MERESAVSTEDKGTDRWIEASEQYSAWNMNAMSERAGLGGLEKASCERKLR